MKRMRRQKRCGRAKVRGGLAGLFLASAVLPGLAQEEDCVPHGGSKKYEFCRPELGVNFPTSAEWEDGDGNPQAWESDLTSNQFAGDMTQKLDDMGMPIPGKFEVEITNTNGDLFGPSGDHLNGFLDGDCIELYDVWYYTYTASIEKCLKGNVVLGADQPVQTGFEKSRCTTIELQLRGFVRPRYCDTVEVCPC